MVGETERTTLDVIREINQKYILDRQGKDFVLYAGLLDLATRNGLQSIETRLEQAPSEANGQTSIVHARVTGKDGRIFEGIGDANLVSTSRMIAPHATRMAETRAKARALRDMLNLGGVAAFEELGGEDEPRIPHDGQKQEFVGRPEKQDPPKAIGRPANAAAERQVREQAQETARPALNVVVSPEQQELTAALKRGLDALGRPVDEEAIGRMSLTMIKVQVRALAEEYFSLHPEQDKRPKREPEGPVKVDAKTSAAMVKSAKEFGREAPRIQAPVQEPTPPADDDYDDIAF